jgi:RimJ/RimL family protein N-acetyltransferase
MITPPAWADTLVLSDGRRIGFRPVTGDDRDGFALMFERMSPESRYRRYLSPKPHLSPPELTFLTDVDHVRHEALAAIDQRHGSIVGVGRYVVYRDQPRVAELALEVVDDLQGMGIGGALSRRVITQARRNAVTCLTATLLWENRPARALLRRLEFHARGSRGTELEMELALRRSGSRPRVPARRW